MASRAAGSLVSRPSPGIAVLFGLAGWLVLLVPSPENPALKPGRTGPVRSSILRRAVIHLVVAAAVVATCVISSGVVTQIAWRLHDVHLPDGIHGVISRLIPGATRSGDLVGLWTGSRLETVRITSSALGVYEIWYLLVALVTFFGIGRVRLGGAAFVDLLGGVGAYALVRFVVLAVLAMEFGAPHVLWRPEYVAISWLPLAMIWGGAIGKLLPARPLGAAGPTPVGKPSARKRPARPTRVLRGARSTLGALLPISAGIVLAFGLTFEDPGHLKPGRLAVDETHADWEWATEPFDTTAYGIRAEYNYYCLAEYLKHFYDVQVIHDGISSGLLDSIDVLIIKTPTEPYGEDEIKKLRRFVAGGGGLFLVGDHTNLFGMSTHLNSIATEFGMRFRHDDTFDLETTGFSRYRRSPLCFHPCLRDLSEFRFLTSCSIQGGLHTRVVLAGYRLASEDIDYSHPNFFGNIAYDLCDRFGVLLQASARTFGKGRVLLFTDSTCFSNFCMFSPGTPDLILGFVDYLNRSGRRYPYALPLAWSLLGFLAYLLWRDMKRGGLGVIGLCLGLFMGAIVGLACVSYLSAWVYGPLPRTDLPRSLLFDVEHTDASFFNYMGALPPPGVLGYEELYLCAQRLGAHPYTGGLTDVLDVPPCGVVVVNPCVGFSSEELACIDTYLEGGGRLLVLDSALNTKSTANQVLSRYGMSVYMIPEVFGEDRDGDRRITPRLAIAGGKPLDDATPAAHPLPGTPEVAIQGVGEGLIVVATDSYRFSHHVLGPVLQHSKPGPLACKVYSEIYRLLAAAFFEPPTPRDTDDQATNRKP